MTRITRRGLTLAAGGLAAGALLGPLSRRAEAAVDLSKVTLRIGDQTGSTRAKLEAAGLLKDVPYRIEWSVYAAAVNLHEALKAEACDIGSSADAPAVSAIAGGSPIQIVAGWGNGGRGRYILVPKDSPIQSLAELKGKTLSPTTRGSVAHYLVAGALKQAGLKTSDVKLAFLTPADASAAFQAGSIDAWGTWGIYAARTIGVLGARILRDGQGINSGLIVQSATRKALTDPGKVAAIGDFCDRVERGYAWTRDAKEEYIDFYAKFSKQDRPTAEFVYDAEATYIRQKVDGNFLAEIQKTYDTWVEAGVLSGSKDMTPFVFRDLAVG